MRICVVLYVVCVSRSDVLSLSDVCLHVAEVTSVKKKLGSSHQSLLPEYNCLLISPAQFWNRDKQRYISHLISSLSNILCFSLG